MKINELEVALSNARILDESQIDLSKVTILANVKLLNKRSNKEVTYKLVSASEANLKEKKISVSSPIGEGLLGLKIGEIAKIQTPGGQIEFEVLDISL